MHPACAFEGPARANYERWSGSAFGNPRLLHLHTCANVAPGEISMNIVDPTISFDGVNIWEDGVCYIDRLPGADEVLKEFPDCAQTFSAPSREIGL
jgi:hypothetical protein